MRRRAFAGAVDVAVAAAAFGLGWWREAANPAQPTRLLDGPVWFLLAVHAASALLLLGRRSRPRATGAGIAALAVLNPTYAVVFAAYAVGLAVPHRRERGWLVLAALPVGWAVGAGVWGMPPEHRFTGLSAIAVAGLAGLYVGARRRLVTALVDRAERAECERELLAERVRAQERARLAAEMHDVVSHRVSLMVLQAGALRVSTADAAARDAAEQLRQAGVQVLAELRDLVGVLRGGGPADAGRDPQAAAGELRELVDGARSAAGMTVELTEDGDPAALEPTVRRTVHRVVQESLTNAGKHAPGAAVSVRVAYGPQQVRATVRNTAPTRAAEPELAAVGGGVGLAGLRQRVELVGGTLRAAPGPDGGFAVDAVLPAYVPTGEPG